MEKEPTCFQIEQSSGGTVVETITLAEYIKKHSVIAMKHALQLRRDTFPFPKGNMVELIMEQFIRDRIPVQCVEKIVISGEAFASFVMYAGAEVSVSLTPEYQYWIFGSVIPVEVGETTQGKYEIYLI